MEHTPQLVITFYFGLAIKLEMRPRVSFGHAKLCQWTIPMSYDFHVLLSLRDLKHYYITKSLWKDSSKHYNLDSLYQIRHKTSLISLDVNISLAYKLINVDAFLFKKIHFS